MIGDGENFQAWTVDVQNLGGQAVTWPFGWQGANTGPYTGAPAARFDAATFQKLVNAGVIGQDDPTGQTANGAYFYVLAPSSVVNTAPTEQQMTVGQQLQNFFFADWGSALAAFPQQLQSEINGVVGWAGNVLANAAKTAGGVVSAGVGGLLTPPVLIAAGVLALVAVAYFAKKRGR